MTRPTAVLSLTLAACAALGWAGEEPEAYDIVWKDHWSVGQMVTVTEHAVSDSETVVNGRSVKSENEVFDATYVLRCDELDGKGEPAKSTLFVKSWKQTQKDRTDESISGLRIAVVGKTWTLPEGKTAGPLATKWLDKTFARDEDNPFLKLAPPRLTVGQAWKPDREAAVAAFAGEVDDIPLDPAGVEMELTLASVTGTPPDASGRIVLRLHAPLSGEVKGLPPGAVVLPGSAIDAVGERSGPLTKATMLGEEHLEMTMAMKVEVSGQGRKVAVATSAKQARDKKTVDGGEIPEPTAGATTQPTDPGKQ